MSLVRLFASFWGIKKESAHGSNFCGFSDLRLTGEYDWRVKKICSKEVLPGLRESRNLKTFLNVQPFAPETRNVKKPRVWICASTTSWPKLHEFPAVKLAAFEFARKSPIMANMFYIHIAEVVKASCPRCSTFASDFGPLIRCFLMEIGPIFELFTFS